MEYETLEDLFKLYGVDENTEKVLCDDIHILLNINEVKRLMSKYTLTWFPEDGRYYYLIPKEG